MIRKTPLVSIKLTPKEKHNKLLNHLIRLSVRMHTHGWLGSECLTFKVEDYKRLRLEYSTKPGTHRKRVIVYAEKEKVRVVNTSPTNVKSIGSMVEAMQWTIKKVETNTGAWGDVTQTLVDQMHWQESDYKKGLLETRDSWLRKLKSQAELLQPNIASTPEWLSHMQSILEFEHPLNKTVHDVLCNLLPNSDAVAFYNAKLKYYTKNSTAQPTVCETIDTLLPIILDQQKTWPAIRLHNDRAGDQHFIFAKPESVVPLLHVKKNAESGEYTLLECACPSLDDTTQVHGQILHEISKPSIPLKDAWLTQLKSLMDFKLLALDDTTTRPDQLWIRCVKNYAAQLHVEMVRNDALYPLWSKHFIAYGDSNVVTTVLAAMKLAREHQPVLNTVSVPGIQLD